MIFVGDADQANLDELNRLTVEWTHKAARGECEWVCCDCGCSFPEGMPDECAYSDIRCTNIIKRDKELTEHIETLLSIAYRMGLNDGIVFDKEKHAERLKTQYGLDLEAEIVHEGVNKLMSLIDEVSSDGSVYLPIEIRLALR